MAKQAQITRRPRKKGGGGEEEDLRTVLAKAKAAGKKTPKKP